jgi:hypothetical protein
MDAATGLSLFKAIADAGKTIAEIEKSITDREIKQELNSVYGRYAANKGVALELFAAVYGAIPTRRKEEAVPEFPILGSVGQ